MAEDAEETRGEGMEGGGATNVVNPTAEPEPLLVNLVTAEESHPQPEELNVEYVVILTCDDRYLKTIPGLVRFTQVVFSILGLICLTSAGTEESGYLLLPLSWNLRFFVFISVVAFLTSALLITAQVTSLIAIFPFNWFFLDMIIYTFLSFFYLIGSSLLASTINYYHIKGDIVQEWTKEQLIAATSLGYLCTILNAVTAILGYMRWRDRRQFRRYRFKDTHSPDDLV